MIVLPNLLYLYMKLPSPYRFFEDMDVIQVTAHDADSSVAYMISESTSKNALK